MQDAIQPHEVTPRPAAAGHIAQLYRNEGELADSVSRYICEGLLQGAAVWIIATPEHWARFVERLAIHPEIDLTAVIVSGQLRIMNADHVISAILAETDGMPLWHRMRDGVCGIIESSRKHFGALRIYGEVAGILWNSGRKQAAERIESYWNALAREYRFTLLCSHKTNHHERGAQLACICGTHAHLFPESGYEIHEPA